MLYRLLTTLAGCLMLLCGLFVGIGQIAFVRQDVLAFTSNRSQSLDIYLIDTRLKIIQDVTYHSTANFSASWSPDGKQLAFISRRGGLSRLFITDLTTDSQAVTDGNSIISFPQWSNEGHRLSYISSGMRSVRVQLLDTSSDEAEVMHIGPPVPQSRAVWSPVQNVLAFSGTEGISHGIYLMDEHGGAVRQIATQRPPRATPIDSAWRAPSWSPDGERIAYSSNGIQIIDLQSGDIQSLTDGYHGAPSWSPDGKRIAFFAVDRGNWDIFSINVDGTDLQRLTWDARADFDPVWQPYD